MLNLSCNKIDDDLIHKIVDRYMAMHTNKRSFFGGIEPPKKLKILMDVLACHCNGCKLNLEGLLKARDFDFNHDIHGIGKHINRETGKLENCFTPRYAETQ